MRVLEKPAVEEGSAEAKRDQGPTPFQQIEHAVTGFCFCLPRAGLASKHVSLNCPSDRRDGCYG